MKIEPAQGDDPNWPVGTDLREYFGVSKWESPLESADGEVETPHQAFHTYTDIEHLANFPGVIADGEDVILTEKLHGKNCRVGLVLVTDTSGNPQWTWMAGSHGQRRKQSFATVRRFLVSELLEQLVLQKADAEVGHVFPYDGGKFWRIIEVAPRGDDVELQAEEVSKSGDGTYAARVKQSEFWEPLTDNVRAMLEHVRDELKWEEPKAGIVLFGELTGTQDMKYGLKNKRGFQAFDIAINGKYLDHDLKKALFAKFSVEMVPILHRGPFSVKLVEEHTDGPTTMCKPEEAGPFGGREGIVIAPAVERLAEAMMPTSSNGRVIFKSVSADYLARKGGTDSH